MGENANTETWDLDWVYAPGEEFFLAACPPYCSSRPYKASAWTTAQGQIQVQQHPLGAGVDEGFIRRWVVQLVRQRLGSHLDDAEAAASRSAPAPVRLTSEALQLSPAALGLIREALRRRMPDCGCAP